MTPLTEQDIGQEFEITLKATNKSGKAVLNQVTESAYYFTGNGNHLNNIYIMVPISYLEEHIKITPVK